MRINEMLFCGLIVQFSTHIFCLSNNKLESKTIIRGVLSWA